MNVPSHASHQKHLSEEMLVLIGIRTFVPLLFRNLFQEKVNPRVPTYQPVHNRTHNDLNFSLTSEGKAPLIIVSIIY